MELRYYPDEKTVRQAVANDDPLLVLVAFDGSEALAANVDDALEHAVLLRKLGLRDTRIDSYFRIVLNKAGADWTFVCPSDYRGIPNRERRIEAFYNDGIGAIAAAIKALGLADVPVQIPARYRRHFDTLSNGS
jgi:hypothetical protein